MNKILIRKDQGAESDFLNGLNNTVKRGNELIMLFNGSQPFVTIASEQSFIELLTDPIQYYDDSLTSNVQHDTRLSVDPSKLAELYSIPREEFLTGVVKCLSVEQYNVYADFIMFKSGELQSDTLKVDGHRDSFNIYATSEQAVNLVTHYENLCKTLNEAIIIHGVGPARIQELAKMFDLQILDNKLIINVFKLSEKIIYENN